MYIAYSSVTLLLLLLLLKAVVVVVVVGVVVVVTSSNIITRNKSNAYFEALQYRRTRFPLPITTRENTSYLYTLFRKSQ